MSRSPLLLIGLALLAAFLFWRLLPPRDDGTLAQVRQRGTLRVGLDASFPPFESIDGNGQIVGFDADIARAIAADLGVEVEFVNIGFDGLYDALLARRVDLVISSLPYDPRRTGDVAYTRNYFNAGQVLLVRADEPAIRSLEDLAGRTVAVEWGSLAELEARQAGRRLAKALEQPDPPFILLRRETAAAAIVSLLQRQADAAVVDAPSAISILPQGLRLVTYVSDEWYTGAVHLQSRQLLTAVNDSLARLEESGQLAAMEARWFHGQ